MICAISGVTPEDPVVSKRSGFVFERRLIEKYLADTGTCPVTNETLTLDDLLPVKSNKTVKPRPLQATSIPGMLSLFQSEWDAVVLSNYQLEQQLHNARQELSHALYQHDAACRVIARLKKERDEAMGMLAEAQVPVLEAPSAPANGKRRAPEEELVTPPSKAARVEIGLTAEIIAELNECNQDLSLKRKKRPISPTLAKVEELEKYSQQSSHPLHMTNKPGILSIDIDQEKDIIFTGGNDANAVVFDRSAGQIKATLTGHSKRVTCVKFVSRDNYVLTGSADKTVRVWQESEDGSYDCKHTFRDHNAEVQAVTVHATNNYFVTASSDKTWAMFDLKNASCLVKVNDEHGFSSAQFHPDGLILGTGGLDSVVRIWDVKNQANVAQFDGHTGSVTDLSFSENGYFLATAGSDGVKLWDLRKLKNFRSFVPYDNFTATNSVQFDHSGSYLAFAGSDIRLYQTASVKADWNMIKTLPDLSGTGKVSCVRFGKDASYLAIGSSDRNLRIFGAPATGNIEQEADA